MKKLYLIAAAAFFALAACSTTLKQDLLDANSDANDTLTRTANYVELPACDATVIVNCHDPATKVELKAEAAEVKTSFDAAWANTTEANNAAAVQANANLEATLTENEIDCRPDKPCP